ncbi:uncharacterized protein LOC121950781 [Plectropomus leopardus]|uniref:uncharacterized protein LOC121950781 n=1 Tax=Plectropomus leopardus TaxID=160734 RepID=UPI001C4C640F|nr:uncharacterized protein LOC121950781 [Plectropomus leopardus]
MFSLSMMVGLVPIVSLLGLFYSAAVDENFPQGCTSSSSVCFYSLLLPVTVPDVYGRSGEVGTTRCQTGGSSSLEAVVSVDFGSDSDLGLGVVSPLRCVLTDHGCPPEGSVFASLSLVCEDGRRLDSLCSTSSVKAMFKHVPRSFLTLSGRLRSNGFKSTKRAVSLVFWQKLRYEESSVLKKFSVCVDELVRDIVGGAEGSSDTRGGRIFDPAPCREEFTTIGSSSEKQLRCHRLLLACLSSIEMCQSPGLPKDVRLLTVTHGSLQKSLCLEGSTRASLSSRARGCMASSDTFSIKPTPPSDI